jgi:hypothetical protein
MAIAPRLTQARLVPTAIGVMNAASAVGGSELDGMVSREVLFSGFKAIFS